MNSIAAGDPGASATATRNWRKVPVSSSQAVSFMDDGLSQNFRSGLIKFLNQRQVVSRLSATIAKRAPRILPPRAAVVAGAG